MAYFFSPSVQFGTTVMVLETSGPPSRRVDQKMSVGTHIVGHESLYARLEELNRNAADVTEDRLSLPTEGLADVPLQPESPR